MAKKTNAARLLDKLGIVYELRTYAVGAEHTEAVEIARMVGMRPEQVFKTLLAVGDKSGPCFAVIAANAELDLKALARVSQNRSVSMAPLKDVQPLTGYVRGGVTALAAKKAYPVYLDASVETLERMSVSAGMRGEQILLSPGDYRRATGAAIAGIQAVKTNEGG